MRTFTPIGRQPGRAGLALAALMAIAAVAGPAAADDWNHQHYRHQHHDSGFISFGFSSPGYYDVPPPGYYAPGPSFGLVIPFGHHHR